MTSARKEDEASGRKSILVVDDHPIVRHAIAGLLNKEPDLQVCAEAESASQAMACLAKASFDLVIVDISLKDVDGLELMRNIRSAHPRIPMLVFSAHDETVYAERVIRAGAMGYVMKKGEKGCLLQGVRQALSGKIYVSDDVVPLLLSRQIGRPVGAGTSPTDLLTDRELEVFRQIGHGLDTRQIGLKLRVSPKTVQRHRDNIRVKLNLKKSRDVLLRAMEWVREQDIE
jgi:DNA-binding NarL/FixJ family response regulator